MPNEEKRSWINGIVTVAGYVTYLVLVLSQAGSRPLVDVGYQVPLLSVIGGAIVASILLSIFAGLDIPRGVTHKDQRDREIAAFGEKVGRSFVVIGGIAALILAMLEI
ncbi:MAG TPA: hypothetical protein VNT53_10895, partial [Pseudolysinimonas sp.]|nr:hypothetical protein [Pseudolysinimonas sp.]